MKGFLQLLVVLIIALLALAFMQPDTFQVKRSIKIDASPEIVFSLIGDLKEWSKWSPWYERDTNMQISFSEDTTSLGGYAEWDSKSEGRGRQTISDIEKNRSLKLDLEFYEPFTGTAKTQFFIESGVNGQTEIVWVMYGKNRNIIDKVFYLFLNFEKMIGRDYERGLSKIKDLAEQAQNNETEG